MCTQFVMLTFFLFTSQLHKRHYNPMIVTVNDSTPSDSSNNEEPQHEVYTISDSEEEKEMEVTVDGIEGEPEVMDEASKTYEAMLTDAGDLSLSIDRTVSIILLN